MAKNYHIIKEIDRVSEDIQSKGFRVHKRISRRGVPHIIVEDSISLCFFWSSKRWKVFDWAGLDNRTITEKDPKDIVSFVEKHLEKELTFEVVKKA
jgi:hypothetical protein